MLLGFWLCRVKVQIERNVWTDKITRCSVCVRSNGMMSISKSYTHDAWPGTCKTFEQANSMLMASLPFRLSFMNPSRLYYKRQEFEIPALGIESIQLHYLKIKKRCWDAAEVIVVILIIVNQQVTRAYIVCSISLRTAAFPKDRTLIKCSVSLTPGGPLRTNTERRGGGGQLQNMRWSAVRIHQALWVSGHYAPARWW